MSAPVDILLARLDGVQKAGQGWRARCPACGGRSRKLSISEGVDQRTLVHCFAGCAALDVVQAVGLQLADLFQRRHLRTMSHAERSAMRQAALIPNWRAAIEKLKGEAIVVQLAASQLGDGIPLSDSESTRLHVAALRVFDAWQVLR